MSVEEATETGGVPAGRVAGVVLGAFSVFVSLAAVAYSVIVNVVDWVIVDFLTYPLEGVAPFVVITGAILTIPIVIPTVLITSKVVE